jgi:hypothetical protein
MTPQEKANEIFEQYFCKLGYHFDGDVYKVAKQCALIAVDEMLSNDGWSGSMEEWHRFKIYFEEVKQEIQKI